MSLTEVLLTTIHSHGPLSVAAYMELCLGHPEYGYYVKQDPFGRDGDFITAPEISQTFGELLGLWVADRWQAQSMPAAALVELGPGRGTLMADALRATRRVSGFHDAIAAHLVETSPALQRRQREALDGAGPPVTWHARIDTLPKDRPLLIVANEFFDALPIRQFVCRGGAYTERLIGEAEGALQWQEADTPTDLTLLLPYAPPTQEGAIIEVSEGSQSVFSSLLARLEAQGGAMAIIDYGYEKARGRDTFQAVQCHAPVDPLTAPGDADLTAHVDFGCLQHLAARMAGVTYNLMTQRDFLRGLGIEVRAMQLLHSADVNQKTLIRKGIERLIHPAQMGTLFRVLTVEAKGKLC